MKKDKTLISAKEALRSTTEEVKKIGSSTVRNRNVQKTINAVKYTAKFVTSKATRAATKATTAAKKTLTKKGDVSFYVQYHGKEVSKETIIEKIHEEWVKSHKLSEIKTIEIYLKVEDNTAYCLVNEEINIDLKLN